MTVENQTARQMEKPTESKRAADIVFYDESLLVRQEKSFERERESREYSRKLMPCAVYATATPQHNLLAQKEIHPFSKETRTFFELSPRSPTPKGAV